MKRKQIFLTLFLLSLAGISFSAAPESKMRLALLDLEAVSIPNETARVVSDLLFTELQNTGSFILIERSRISSLLAEQGLQQSGCTETECAVQMGKILAANRVLLGTVSKLGNSYIINARIVNVETGVLDFADKHIVSSENELVTGTEQFAKILTARIHGKPIPSSERSQPTQPRSTSPRPEIHPHDRMFFDAWCLYGEGTHDILFQRSSPLMVQTEFGLTGISLPAFSSLEIAGLKNTSPTVFGLRFGFFHSFFGVGAEVAYWRINVSAQQTTLSVNQGNFQPYNLGVNDFLSVSSIPFIVDLTFLRLRLGKFADIYAAVGAGISLNIWEMPTVKGYTSTSDIFQAPTSYSDTGYTMTLPFGLRLHLGDKLDLFVEGRYLYNSFRPFRNVKGSEDKIESQTFGICAGIGLNLNP